MARWLLIIEAFAAAGEWGVRDLTAATRLPRSAVHRILHEMHQYDMLTLAERPGRFTVGPSLIRVAALLLDSLDVTRHARVVLEEAARISGETVILTLYDPKRRQFFAVDAVESAQTVRYIWRSLREWNDLHIGSSGKGILAFLPREERDAVVDALPDPIPGLRQISKAQLRQQLERARRQGYVLTHGERYPGAFGASAPVRNAVRLIGDLIITWPDNRNRGRERTLAALAATAASKLSVSLGYRAPGDAPRGLAPVDAYQEDDQLSLRRGGTDASSRHGTRASDSKE
ncbi:MAG TPA: IclR family transcriptional regulator C-terminal domain-containing protein [bacterium]|nr:IclR family transcriptional regulator C-terminal domain-containing protein [bacterium]